MWNQKRTPTTPSIENIQYDGFFGGRRVFEEEHLCPICV